MEKHVNIQFNKDYMSVRDLKGMAEVLETLIDYHNRFDAPLNPQALEASDTDMLVNMVDFFLTFEQLTKGYITRTEAE